MQMANFRLTEQSLENLKSEGLPDNVINKLEAIKNQAFTDKKKFLETLTSKIGDEQTVRYKSLILEHVIQFKYKAFISYSHAADKELAPKLQSELQKFAKPFYQPRAIRIFRDETNLEANPKLWTSIEDALNNSEYFVLMA